MPRLIAVSPQYIRADVLLDQLSTVLLYWEWKN